MANNQAFDTRTTNPANRSVQAVGLSVAAITSGGNPTGDWVFQTESYLSPLSLTKIYPRPDSETREASYHRKAHTGLTYRVPVGVRGGCWPYRYEIVSGPSGATITGELTRSSDAATGKTLHTISDDYGVITWDTAGVADGTSFSFTVRVTDQLGATVTLTWSGSVDNDSFVFVDSVNGNDANLGDQANPLQTFANGLWKNDDDDSTFAGKIAVCSGTMDINAGTLDTSPILDDAVKPVAYITDSACTFNTSRGHFRTSNQIDDLLFMGIDFNGSRSDLSNNRIFNLLQSIQRPVFFECSWDNITVGNVGNDNPCCVGFFDNVSPLHSYIFMAKCEQRDNCDVQLVVTFNSNQVLLERNFGLNVNLPSSNGDYCLHPKDDTSNLTVRANTFHGTAGTSMIGISNQNTMPALIENQEACYNTLIFEGDQGTDGAMTWDQSAQSPDGQNTHNYRNTVISETSLAYRENNSSVDSFDAWGFADVCVGGGSDSLTTPAGAPAIVELLISDFDANGKLINSARSTYLGTHGAELAGA